MQERSLKVMQPNTTFFSKISSTLSKLLVPTRVGLNGMLITVKRNSTIKCYDNYKKLETSVDVTKKDQAQKRYEESYTLYLESIDKFIMDSVYKKVKNGTASAFEKDALANYYNIVHLKENEYLEYKYRKQKFLLELDFETIKQSKKDKTVEKFTWLYIEKMDILYKGILKNYSVKLADGLKAQNTASVQLYMNIFNTLEEYIKRILPIKLEIDKENSNYTSILKSYEEYEKFSVGKLDEKDFLEKNMILLGLSRVLFTHSLPLVAAEQCYNKLLKDVRSLIVNSKADTKKEDAYQMLLKLIEDYNVKLLSTKVYWENPEERDKYKKFWTAYSNSTNSEEKEILSLRRELSQIANVTDKDIKLRAFYKKKLVEFGVMRKFRDSSVTGKAARYVKIK